MSETVRLYPYKVKGEGQFIAGLIKKTENNAINTNILRLNRSKMAEKFIFSAIGKEMEIPFDAVIQKTNSEYFIKSEAGNFTILNSTFDSITKQNYKYLEFAYNNYFIATNEGDKIGVIDIDEKTVVEFKSATSNMINPAKKEDIKIIKSFKFLSNAFFIFIASFAIKFKS